MAAAFNAVKRLRLYRNNTWIAFHLRLRSKQMDNFFKNKEMDNCYLSGEAKIHETIFPQFIFCRMFFMRNCQKVPFFSALVKIENMYIF